MFIVLLSSIVSHSSKYMLLKNKKCMTQSTLINLHLNRARHNFKRGIQKIITKDSLNFLCSNLAHFSNSTATLA